MKTYDLREIAEHVNTTYSALRMWVQKRVRDGQINIDKYRHRAGGTGGKFAYSEDFLKFIKANYVRKGERSANNKLVVDQQPDDRYPVYIELSEDIVKGIDKAVLQDEILPIIIKTKLKITRKMILEQLK